MFVLTLSAQQHYLCYCVQAPAMRLLRWVALIFVILTINQSPCLREVHTTTAVAPEYILPKALHLRSHIYLYTLQRSTLPLDKNADFDQTTQRWKAL